jgi:hypothetical protein
MLYIIYFDPYRVRKTTKNDLESSNAFRFVSHLGSLLLGHPTPGSHDWSGHLGKGGITKVPRRGTDRGRLPYNQSIHGAAGFRPEEFLIPNWSRYSFAVAPNSCRPPFW